jgi:hypothetical protein
MMYDLFADFYVKSSDSQPKYIVLMGSYHPKTINEMEKLGFKEDPDSDFGYVDYVMDADEEDLQEYTQDGFCCEMMDILDSGIDYEKILIHAYEVEAIDDEGGYPPRARQVGDTLITFTESDPDSPVIFEKRSRGSQDGEKCRFEVPISSLKQQFNVKTMTELITLFSDKEESDEWTFEKLKNRFLHGRITLDDIIPVFGMADHVAFALKDDYERNHGKEDYDPVVMYVKLHGKEPVYWFDRAHVGETLAPMSLWDITEKERNEYLAFLENRFPQEALKTMLKDASNHMLVLRGKP